MTVNKQESFFNILLPDKRQSFPWRKDLGNGTGTPLKKGWTCNSKSTLIQSVTSRIDIAFSSNF